MLEEKKIFNRTMDEIRDIKRSVDGYVDCNHPKTKRVDGGSFADALRKGAEMLRADESFAHVFQTDWYAEE